MKRITRITLFLAVVLLSLMQLSAQHCLGWSKREIMNKFDAPKYQLKIEPWKSEKGVTREVIIVKEGFGRVVYLLNQYDRCLFTYILPLDNKFLNIMIKGMNKDFVKISDTQWKSYEEGGIVTIRLQYDEDGSGILIFKKEYK